MQEVFLVKSRSQMYDQQQHPHVKILCGRRPCHRGFAYSLRQVSFARSHVSPLLTAFWYRVVMDRDDVDLIFDV